MSRQHFTYLFAEELTPSQQEEIKTKLFPYKLWKIVELDKVTVTKYPTTLRDTKGR